MVVESGTEPVSALQTGEQNFGFEGVVSMIWPMCILGICPKFAYIYRTLYWLMVISRVRKRSTTVSKEGGSPMNIPALTMR